MLANKNQKLAWCQHKRQNLIYLLIKSGSFTSMTQTTMGESELDQGWEDGTVGEELAVIAWGPVLWMPRDYVNTEWVWQPTSNSITWKAELGELGEAGELDQPCRQALHSPVRLHQWISQRTMEAGQSHPLSPSIARARARMQICVHAHHRHMWKKFGNWVYTENVTPLPHHYLPNNVAHKWHTIFM